MLKVREGTVKEINCSMSTNIKMCVWSRYWKKMLFIPLPRKEDVREHTNYQGIVVILHKIVQNMAMLGKRSAKGIIMFQEKQRNMA